jgi:hypothetical protein
MRGNPIYSPFMVAGTATSPTEFIAAAATATAGMPLSAESLLNAGLVAVAVVAAPAAIEAE